MPRTNMHTTRRRPATTGLLTLRVLRRERVSPHFARVTLGEGDIEQFAPMGFDQWFRLFIPVSDGSLSRVPAKLSALSYARFLMVSKTTRPVMRSYSVRAFRPEAGELDVDFVLHGSVDDGTCGPAAAWAQTCSPGDPVAILDEGVGFNPPDGLSAVTLVAEESGLPAMAGVLRSLPDNATGRAFIEIPDGEDSQELAAPSGVDIQWIVREDPHGVPGRAAAEAVRDIPTTGYHWVVGESALATGMRGHWARTGVSKERIMFCGYWKHRR
ncbi:MAG TPA: siderophore-interacting protein [Stackebrandtia sp.]|jgi:NADPH-dependent ferric siderophore reductase|uniref:siderophore-interacting protein n=1 Tax=Stackebrandtia sp. TaxID=2023065 RepID=UPI002D272025|nr:siderophore-interacting protein [Stackebrandtia sp.]HZE40018.1 siderophore-interacting protein [Stackebrandtia sp.]